MKILQINEISQNFGEVVGAALCFGSALGHHPSLGMSNLVFKAYERGKWHAEKKKEKKMPHSGKASKVRTCALPSGSSDHSIIGFTVNALGGRISLKSKIFTVSWKLYMMKREMWYLKKIGYPDFPFHRGNNCNGKIQNFLPMIDQSNGKTQRYPGVSWK